MSSVVDNVDIIFYLLGYRNSRSLRASKFFFTGFDSLAISSRIEAIGSAPAFVEDGFTALAVGRCATKSRIDP